MVHKHFHIGSHTLREQRLVFLAPQKGAEQQPTGPEPLRGVYETKWETVKKHFQELDEYINNLEDLRDPKIQGDLAQLKQMRNTYGRRVGEEYEKYEQKLWESGRRIEGEKFQLEKSVYEGIWNNLVTKLDEIERSIEDKLPPGYEKYTDRIRREWDESLDNDKKLVAKHAYDTATRREIYYVDMPDTVRIAGLQAHNRTWGEKRAAFYADQRIPETVTVSFDAYGKEVQAKVVRRGTEIHFEFGSDFSLQGPLIANGPDLGRPVIPDVQPPLPPELNPFAPPLIPDIGHFQLPQEQRKPVEAPQRQETAKDLAEKSLKQFDRDAEGFLKDIESRVRMGWNEDVPEMKIALKALQDRFVEHDKLYREHRNALVDRGHALERKFNAIPGLLHHLEFYDATYKFSLKPVTERTPEPAVEPGSLPPIGAPKARPDHPSESSEDKFNKIVVEVDQLLIQLWDRVTLIGNDYNDPKTNGLVDAINTKLASATLPVGHGWHEFRLNRAPMVYRDAAGRKHEYLIRNIYWNDEKKNPQIMLEKHQESPSDVPPFQDPNSVPKEEDKDTRKEPAKKVKERKGAEEKESSEKNSETLDTIMERVVGGFVNELKNAMSFEAPQRRINKIVTKINTALNQESYDKNVTVSWNDANQWMRSKLDTLNGVGYTVEYKEGTDVTNDPAKLTVKEVREGIDEKEREILEGIEKIFRENDFTKAIEALLKFLRDKGILPKEPEGTPPGSDSAPPPNPPEGGRPPEGSEKQSPIEKLEKEIKEIETKLEEAKKRWQELLGKDSKLFSGPDASEMRRLNQEIRKYEEALQAKHEELRKLKTDVEKAGDLKPEVKEKIASLEQNKKELEQDLRSLQAKIDGGDNTEFNNNEKKRLEDAIKKINEVIDALRKDPGNYVPAKPTSPASKENPNAREIPFTKEALQKFVNENLLKKLHDEIANESYDLLNLVSMPVTVEGGKVNLSLIFEGAINDVTYNRLKSKFNQKMKTITGVEHSIDRSGQSGLVIKELTQDQIVAIAKGMTGLELKFKVSLSPDEETKANIEKWVKSHLELFVGDKKILSKVEIEVKDGKASFKLVFHRDIGDAYVMTVPSLQKYLTQGSIIWSAEKKAIILEGVTQADVQKVTGEYILRWLAAMEGEGK